MKKETIQKTAICFWDSDSECYVVRSPLFKRVMGAGETPEEAWKIFKEILEDTYEAYKAQRLAEYNGPGRPRKNKVRINTEISPDIKVALETMATDIGISQGEAIEYCITFYKAFGVDPQWMSQNT